MRSASDQIETQPWLPDDLSPLSKLRRLELSFWACFFSFVVIGYYAVGKSFAYVGVPQAKIFIGEIFLVTFVAAWPTGFLSTWVTSLIRPHPLTVFGWTHLIFLGYGLFETLRGLQFGYSLSVAILNVVFNVYPIYIFVGFWFASRVPDILERIIPVIATINAFYGIGFVVLFNKWADILIPGTQVSVFGQPGGSLISLLGLIVLAKPGGYYKFLILLNALVLLGTQVRGDWLGFLVGLLIWGGFTGNLGKVFQAGAVLIAILAIGLITDVRLPGVAGRGGETSARDMVGRALAGIDKEAAKEFSKDADAYSGTLQWRKNWWKEIWIAVHADQEKTFFGLGYGFPLATLVTYIGNEVVATRTPHSILYYALGYSGWVGVLLFLALQISIAYTVWVTYRKTHYSLALAIFTSTLVTASAGNCLETPFGAIPFYSVLGMCIARQVTHREPDFADAEDEPAAFHAYEVSPLPSFPPFVKPTPVAAHPNFHGLRRED